MLFEWRQRRVFLTDAGERFYQAVRGGAGQHPPDGAGPAPAEPSQSLVLSCEPTLLMRWLIALARLPGSAPGAGRTPDGGRRRPQLWQRHRSRHPAQRLSLACRALQPVAFRRADRPCLPAGQGGALLLNPGGCAGPQANGPVCTSAKTRPGAWLEWQQHAGMSADEEVPGQTFEHFYFSLQAAVAGLGVAIGPYRQVCDDIEAGLLVAPLGFVPDGTGYHLLAPAPPEPGSPPTSW